MTVASSGLIKFREFIPVKASNGKRTKERKELLTRSVLWRTMGSGNDIANRENRL